MRYRNRNTGEERVTVDGSRLDKRVKDDPDWEPVPDNEAVQPTFRTGGVIVVDDAIGLTDDEGVA